MSDQFDLIVVGGGPGGYVGAIRAAQLGAKVAIVEEREVGGTCLNRGCIPSKALIKCAEVLDEVKSGKTFGINVEGVSVDYDAVRKHKDRTIKQLVTGVQGLLKAGKVECFCDRAKLLSGTEVELKDGARLTGKNILWATGSVPFVLPIPGHDGPGIFTSDDAVHFPDPPANMAIIGGGAIGCEFAYVYSRFGTKVTLVEMMAGIMPTEDPEATEVVASALKKGGVRIATAAKAQAIEQREGKNVLVYEQGGEAKTVEADLVFMAAGRRANTANMGLEEAGIQLERGCVMVDPDRRTSLETVFAVGDVTRGIGLAHWASHEAISVVEMLYGPGEHIREAYVPGVVFTHPEIGSVGQREHECRACNMDIIVGKFPFQALGKAAATRQREGFVKLVAEADSGRIIGGTIVGPSATELIAEVTLACQMGLTVSDVAETMHSHPTMSEAVGEAAMDAMGQAIHSVS